jgi:hypothetical protein
VEDGFVVGDNEADASEDVKEEKKEMICEERQLDEDDLDMMKPQ